MGGQLVCRPGLYTAIEVVVALVADDIEQPDEAPGPAATFIVVHHIHGVGAMAEFAEQLLELAQGRQQAGRRGWPSWVRLPSTKRAPGICPLT
ncbi:hypothetical protein QFA96_03290 [Pseudomonas sp. Ap32]|nr:hypothetical protein QFA96_03290 [Pseudomonas sp. Ap32]